MTLEEAMTKFQPGWHLSLAADGKWGVLVEYQPITLSYLAGPRGSYKVIGVGNTPQEALEDAHQSYQLGEK